MTAAKSASPEGTQRHARRWIGQGCPADAYRSLGRTGLMTSSLGFGTYRVDDRNPEYAAALGAALKNGLNLIDTSTNYMDGRSESAIGQVLSDQARDEIIVVSKVGYVQGQALELAYERERRGSPFPDMVKYADGCWHCIHPEFIADQLDRSLNRLGVETVDVYLLHNPEYFLSEAVHHRTGISLEQLRNEFYDRIRRAFAHLESEVERGRINYYGVSSNTFVAPVEDPENTSLERMWTIAGDLTPDHHFAVAQLPANLLETGAMLTGNNKGGRQTVLRFARENHLAVLVNRPLNAFYQGHLVRLADTPVPNPEIHSRIDPFLPEDVRNESLSRKALAILSHTEGVTCVLNGMRRRDYVSDAVQVLRSPGFKVDPGIYEALL